MMNIETKHHIDNARRILVGVVPNPISQIDQITYALIYKFMDDMDQAAIKTGGEPSFFVDNLERYAWTRLMDARIGNQERMNLYSEGLSKFSEAQQLPELFRNIFKSAALPYRSPETLGLFLKEVSYFDYSHPEELGNAYEYLLSIMGSQGDAGQFRTPRHIIDFIVAVMDPTKDDKVLDPACGTGGFLVSSYKHILESHKDSLRPAERNKLMNNFEGYDIDPSMVRIAQVNMYLHRFKNPNIYNYDTLSSDDRWNDKFDVVLANPPFMSPKGGINPHSKFSIQSSRSEVLFVDYIMNHLRPKGRAGIIVPEGVIFQSGSAYKQLRKNLLENGLYAVISLPSGVFQPYSGVKTSILLLNNAFIKQNSEILFCKIENDGYGLGAQRRPIDKNDLPGTLEILNKWKTGRKVEDKLAVYVEKTKIAESGDYNLSGDRYRLTTDYAHTKWPMVELRELCSLQRGLTYTSEQLCNEDNGIPFYNLKSIKRNGSEQKNDFKYFTGEVKDKHLVMVGDLLIALTDLTPTSELIGSPKMITDNVRAAYSADLAKINMLGEKINASYLYHLLRSQNYRNYIISFSHGANVKHLQIEGFIKYQIPLPPLEIQEQIVAELDGYSSIITGARQIVENWKPKIDINLEWGKVKLGDICIINPKKSELKKFDTQTEVSFVPMSDLNQNESLFEVKQTKKLSEVVGSYTYFAENDVLLAKVTPCFENGKAGIARNLKNNIGFGSSEFIVIRPQEKVLPEIIYTYVASNIFKNNGKIRMTGTGGLQRVPASFIQGFEIFLPPFEIQQQIVEKIEAERALVESSKKLIAIYEQKTKETIAKIWNE